MRVATGRRSRVRFRAHRRRAALGLGALFFVALLILPACETGGGTVQPPDLSSMVARLTSHDPAVQELALRPEMRARPGEPAGVLPARSKLVILPDTWVPGQTDERGLPSSGAVSAELERPGTPVVTVEMQLVRVGDEWFVEETSPV